MDKNTILMILVILLMAISIASPIFFYLNTISPSHVDRVGGGAVASVSVFVPAECGDGLCELDELCSSCPGDCGICVFECGNDICDTNETCNTCPVDCGSCIVSGGGGGGGSGGGGFTPALRINFKFEPGVIQEQMFQGGSLIKTINITNIGIESIDVDLSVIDLENFIFLDEKTIYLKSGETEQFDALISVSESTESKVFLGDIKGKAGNIEKSIPVVLRIIEEDAPFRIQINISEETKVIKPGELVKANINILNSLGPLSAALLSSIKDRQENVLLDKIDEVDLNFGENIFPQEFKVPIDLEPDYYLFFVNMTYGGKNYIDAVTFRVESPVEITGFFAEDYIVYSGIIGSILILLVLFYFIKKYFSRKKMLFVKKRKKEKIVPRVSIIQTINKLKNLKKRADKKYGYSLVEEFFKIIKSFFAKYYHFNNNLTFEEMKNKLNKKDIKQKQMVISFIDKIAHIPYTYSLIPKSKFIGMVNEAISILNSYKSKAKLDKVKKSNK